MNGEEINQARFYSLRLGKFTHADVFLGWAYGVWEDSSLGKLRNQYMISEIGFLRM